jgi:hypothetical protein
MAAKRRKKGKGCSARSETANVNLPGKRVASKARTRIVLPNSSVDDTPVVVRGRLQPAGRREKPQLNLPIQLVGILVGLFGLGYWMVASDPFANRNILLLGFWSKALGSLLGIYYVGAGKLPPLFLAVLLVSDIGYLPPFYVILRRLKERTPPDTENVLE